ncbi:EmrB/QacA subfamily drug resistance transporter [Crossiella equi]|uniref:EmrB/QacA subfamily drug resistance transporter n=1 Tax=Crossiella equi TaxID=130796 RepID=A0ABS5AER6_9PSEU|nr:MFS transporter [Crossiella equi]MBP2475088.1 EmrB/QacA subfamily drug resistance transporter [Crossiella equi]
MEWKSTQARAVLATTILGSGMAMLDGTVVNVALPAIGGELGASVSGLQWILDGYLLALASLILIAGTLGDRYGRRRMFVIGVVWFGLASLLCGVAPTTELLVLARVFQGVGGALLTPGSLAIIQASFPREHRARAIGAWSGLSGLASVLGPLVGGLLVQAGSWRLVFLINLPLAAVCVWLAVKYVPESSSGAHERVDFLGSVIGALGLAGLTGALVEGPGRGFGDPLVLGALVLGVAGMAVFVLMQVRGRHPLVPPALFANRTFVLANGLTFLVYAALGGVMMLLVLQLQVSLHYAPTAAGLAGLPISLIMLVFSARSGRLAQRVGPRLQLVAGPMLVAGGILLLNLVVPGASYPLGVLPGVLVFGVGLALAVAPVTATVLAAAPDAHAGAASGVNNAVARTGSLLAVAVLPAVAGLGGEEYADPVALTAGWHVALLVCAALCAAGGLLALGVDNRVLAEPAAPDPGEKLSCPLDAPPAHLDSASQKP